MVADLFVGGLRLLTMRPEIASCSRCAWKPQRAALGVQFVYGTTIRTIDVQCGAVAQITTDKAVFTADRFVMA